MFVRHRRVPIVLASLVALLAAAGCSSQSDGSPAKPKTSATSTTAAKHTAKAVQEFATPRVAKVKVPTKVSEVWGAGAEQAYLDAAAFMLKHQLHNGVLRDADGAVSERNLRAVARSMAPIARRDWTKKLRAPARKKTYDSGLTIIALYRTDNDKKRSDAGGLVIDGSTKTPAFNKRITNPTLKLPPAAATELRSRSHCALGCT